MTRNLAGICSLIACLLCAEVVSAAALSWDNNNGDTLWTTGTNWNPDIGGAPATIDTITFNNTGTAGAAGTTTNTVNTSVTVTSLSYDSTAAFHTTQINNGQTLAVSGGGVFLAPGGAVAATTHVTLKGDTPGVGTFSVNSPATNVILGRVATGVQNSTLDASTLGTMNITASRIDVGFISNNGGGGGTVNFNLAANNNFTLDQLRLGGWNSTSVLRLGTANNIKADTIELGWGQPNGANATLQFNTGLTNPGVTIRNKAGTGPAALNIGYGTGGVGTGHLNLTGGVADVMLSTAVLGRPRADANNVGNGTGTITFNLGTIDVTTMTLGQGTAPANAASQATGTVNVNGGTLIADTIFMADVQSIAQARGFLNIAGGTVRATSIVAGLGTGASAPTRQLNFTSGTLSNKAGTNLTVSAAIDMRLIGNALKQISVDAGRTVTLNANIQNSGAGPFSGLTKVGAGKLLLNGTNTYTGNTLISAGTVGGKGTVTSDFTVASGATLSPGNSAGTFLTDDLNMQAGSNLLIEIGGTSPGTQYDQVLANGAVTLNGNLIVNLLNGFMPQYNNSFTIIDGASVTGQFKSVTVIGAEGYFDVVYMGDQVLLTHFAVPEPSTLSLLWLATVGLVQVRRRRAKATQA